MASYDLKAILGEKLKRLTEKTLKALVDCMCTVGASLCSLDKRVSALESVELPEGGYKPMQEPVASPRANGTAIQFIESVSQDATGRMTATKKTVQDGTTSQKGAVQLEDSHSSTSTTKAATPNSVKSAYDLANTANTGLANKLDKTGDGKDVTATFTEDSTRATVETGEKLSVVFGKIKKWFTDLKALAFKDTVSDSDISGTISDNHIASASTWNGKADKSEMSVTPGTGEDADKTTIQLKSGTSATVLTVHQDVSQKTAKKVLFARCCAGITTSTITSKTKRIALSSACDYGIGSLYAIYFENGNSVNPVQSDLWFWIYLGSDTSGDNHDLKIRVYGSDVSRIAAGKTYLFVRSDVTSGLHLVGEVNSTIDFTARNNGVYYDFVKNNGVSGVVDAYPYQPPSNTTDTFLGEEVAYVNTTTKGLIQPFAVSKSGSTYGYALTWANYPDTKWDFIDVTIRIAGWYKSSSSRDESLTIEPLKGTAGGYAAANLPELSASLKIISDNTKRNFGFTINRRYSYKEFLNRVGKQTSALSYGITFPTQEASSAEQHKVYISDIWTRAVYYGQRS